MLKGPLVSSHIWKCRKATSTSLKLRHNALSILALLGLVICALSGQSIPVPAVGNGANVRFPILNVYNVLDFGADPTGTLNSDGPIQNAIYAACNGNGSKVLVPPGTYLVANHLNFQSASISGVPCNNMEFVGLPGSRATTILRATGDSFGAIIYDTTAHTNLEIANLTFDANRQGAPSDVGVGCLQLLNDDFGDSVPGYLTNVSIHNNIFENTLAATQAVLIGTGYHPLISPLPVAGGSLTVSDNLFLNNVTNYGGGGLRGNPYGQETFAMSGQANFDITRNIFTGNVSNGGMLGLYAYAWLWYHRS